MNTPLEQARLSVLGSLLTLGAWEAHRVHILVHSALQHREPAALRMEAARWPDSWVGKALEALALALEAEVFAEHMAAQDPTRLEADRMEAWGESDD